jgi:hypothetical protein
MSAAAPHAPAAAAPPPSPAAAAPPGGAAARATIDNSSPVLPPPPHVAAGAAAGGGAPARVARPARQEAQQLLQVATRRKRGAMAADAQHRTQPKGAPVPKTLVPPAALQAAQAEQVRPARACDAARRGARCTRAEARRQLTTRARAAAADACLARSHAKRSRRPGC